MEVIGSTLKRTSEIHYRSSLLFVTIFILLGSAPTSGLKCYKCGQFTYGVGSITPCVNYTEEVHLKECPAGVNYCIKYVSEGSIVRDCVAKCKEKDESWGTKEFCCEEDGCNSSIANHNSWFVLLSCVLLAKLQNIAF